MGFEGETLEMEDHIFSPVAFSVSVAIHRIKKYSAEPSEAPVENMVLLIARRASANIFIFSSDVIPPSPSKHILRIPRTDIRRRS